MYFFMLSKSKLIYTTKSIEFTEVKERREQLFRFSGRFLGTSAPKILWPPPPIKAFACHRELKKILNI